MNRSRTRLAIALSASLLILVPLRTSSAAPSEEPPAEPSVVLTDAGLLQGRVIDKARVFNGIPYAAAPVGRLRWKSPQPVRPWSGVREATKPASPCPQTANAEAPAGSNNEDCLYLNVTTPATTTDEPRPVVVWVPGGGFYMGDGSSYGGEKLAKRGDVVVVTINYRLGIFGFFGLDGLPGSGTFGLQDQQAALRWVQRNALAFGGDPRNVTLAGESAGGMSTCAQLTSPAAAGLFAKAVLQSGSCAFNWARNSQYPGQAADSVWTPQATLRKTGAAVSADLGCPGGASALACLRRLPAAKLVKEILAFTQPAYRTAVLPESPAKAMQAGRFHRVPVLSGNNHDEATPWLVAFNGGVLKDADYHRLVTDMAGAGKAAKIEREYPLSRYRSAADAWATVTTDRIWSCTQVANDRQAARKVPVFAYEFSDKHSPLVEPGQGAAHGAELPYLFSLRSAELPLTPTQTRLSNQMLDYWTAFAHNGNPNGPGRPYWSPVRDRVTGPSLAPTDQGGIQRVDLSAEHHCDFWAGLK